jgi:hypothetical protein
VGGTAAAVGDGDVAVGDGGAVGGDEAVGGGEAAGDGETWGEGEAADDGETGGDSEALGDGEAAIVVAFGVAASSWPASVQAASATISNKPMLK